MLPLFFIALLILASNNFITYSYPQLPVPREETVVFGADTPFTIFDSANPFIPHGTQWFSGLQQIGTEWCWYYDWATGKVIYWRITGWEYKDNFTTLILHVRKGVTWNDGHPFTARDIVFTINMLKEHPQLYWGPYMAEWVESAEAPDNYTAIIRLKKPNPTFHHRFRVWGGPYIVPEHVWKDKDPMTFKNFPPVTTAPYKLYKVYPELKMYVWIRDENYWGKKFGYFPEPKYVIFMTVPPTDILFREFVRGGIDVPPRIFNWEQIKLAKAVNPKIIGTAFTDGGTIGLVVNHRKYPLNLPEVRWAISYSIDRERIAKLWPYCEGGTKPAKSPFPPWKGLEKYQYKEIFERYPLEFNITKANEILDELGFKRGPDGIRVTPNGTRLSFVIQTTAYYGDPMYFVALIIAENLRKIGIEASVKSVVSAVFWENQRTGKFDAYVEFLGISDMAWGLGPLAWFSQWETPSPVELEAMKERGEVDTEWHSPELDKIIEEAEKLSPEDPRLELLQMKGTEITWKNLPVIPVIYPIYTQAYSTQYWTGWPTKDNLYITPFTWFPHTIFILFNLRRA